MASSPRNSFQGAKPLSGDHRMAALLISSFFPTNGVADCYSGNHQGKNHHELREHLKVTHDSVPPFTFVVRCEGKAKSQAPSDSLHAMEPFYQPHGFILSYGYIPVNHIERFYRLFVWIWRLYCGDLLSGRNTYIPSQTDSSLCIPPCTSIGMFCLRFTPVIAVLLQRFAFGSRLLFDAERQTGRLAVSCVPVPPGRDRQ